MWSALWTDQLNSITSWHPINSRRMHVHKEQHHLSEIKLPVLIAIHQQNQCETFINPWYQLHTLTLWKTHCLALMCFSLLHWHWLHCQSDITHDNCDQRVFLSIFVISRDRCGLITVTPVHHSWLSIYWFTLDIAEHHMYSSQLFQLKNSSSSAGCTSHFNYLY